MRIFNGHSLADLGGGVPDRAPKESIVFRFHEAKWEKNLDPARINLKSEITFYATSLCILAFTFLSALFCVTWLQSVREENTWVMTTLVLAVPVLLEPISPEQTLIHSVWTVQVRLWIVLHTYIHTARQTRGNRLPESRHTKGNKWKDKIPCNFFRSLQWKFKFKIYSSTRYDLSMNRFDWPILAGKEARTVAHSCFFSKLI